MLHTRFILHKMTDYIIAKSICRGTKALRAMFVYLIGSMFLLEPGQEFKKEIEEEFSCEEHSEVRLLLIS